MELNSVNKEPDNHLINEIVECGICKKQVRRISSACQENFSFGTVCNSCYKTNSLEDLELMANLFLTFGGHFGIKPRKSYTLYNIIKKLITKIKSGESTEILIDQNIKMLHQALLYGITPQELISGLKNFM